MLSCKDWSIHRGGALFLDGVEDVAVRGCAFERVGGNGLFLSGHCGRTAVAGNTFRAVGDSAMATVGSFRGGDGTVSSGAGAAAFPFDSAIVGNHVAGVGVHGKQTSALFSALTCRTRFAGNVAYNGPRAGVNLNDGFCGGHVLSSNLLFNWVRETQDHGPINTWNRACYTQTDPATGRPSLTPGWTHIARNFIMNGPSGNRDLGNMFPAIDNDDGSAYFRAASNVLVYGGAKNFLGHDKVWVDNLVAFPDRWAGDPCVCAWGGEANVYENNTCVLGTATNTRGQHVDPVGLDTYPFSGPDWGFVCHIDLANASLARYTARYGGNSYFLPAGGDGEWVFGAGC